MIGGVIKEVDSEEYIVCIEDERGVMVPIIVYGIETISKVNGSAAISDIIALFPYVEANRLRHSTEGEIELLVGMKFADYHPKCIDSRQHLLLLENRFGLTIAGSHSIVKEFNQQGVNHVEVLRTAVALHCNAAIDRFYTIESLGVSCSPACGSCKCGTCQLGGKNMTIKEEKESKLIDSKLRYQEDKGKFIACYPWIKDPCDLPDSRNYAYAMLLATEKRLRKNGDLATLIQRQIDDLLGRGAARKVSKEELSAWMGPKFYIALLAVMKPDSTSTPCRLVFDSGHRINGNSLNDFLAKGPSFLNDQLGILLRFREGRVGYIGDISKMFHAIDIPKEDQMVHLFLWRNMDSQRTPDVYAITVVNMGDKPSAAIAQLALRKAAEMAPESKQEAKEVVLNNSYMDDILGSRDSKEEVEAITSDISTILKNCNFVIKEWNVSGQDPPTQRKTEDQEVVNKLLNAASNSLHQKALGMYWDKKEDKLMFSSTIRSTDKPITKRMILSNCNSIYDPFGFIGPFTIKLKILLRMIWAHEPKLDWDTVVPDPLKQKWLAILEEIETIPILRFPRSLTPPNASKEGPELIIFSDGSKQAYGAVAYIRWKTDKGYDSRLIAAKSRIAPLKVEDIVRLELCGAVLSARLRTFISKELNLSFKKVYHIVDSEIVQSMIAKASYGFNTFEANRVGEIHRNTSPEDWIWIEGSLNIADIITRGVAPEELGEGSLWQRGPEFLKVEVSEWPAKFQADPPIETFNALVAEAGEAGESGEDVDKTTEETKDTLQGRIDISRFSRLMVLLHTTARILKLYKRFKQGGDMKDTEVTPGDIDEAKIFWIKDAQKNIHAEKNLKKYVKLRPQLVDGVFQVGGRTERWMEATWNKQKFILLPKEHRLSYLIALYEHVKIGHLATAATVSRIRSNYWIVGVVKIVNAITENCRWCKEKFKRYEQQIMSPLPIERIKPSPPFFNVGVDYFGPYSIKGEVQKRVKGKAYGAIFTCLSSRAVYVDLAKDSSTDSFLQVFRRFITIRGSPQKIFSDNGSNLVGASNELKQIVKNLNWKEIRDYGLQEGTQWTFSPGNAPWYNGATEALVKSTKRALNAMVGDILFTFSELQTALFEAAQLVNQRPIGLHPSKPDDGSYLCPNDLILGRSSSQVPQGPFQERNSNKHRIDFIEKVAQAFWKRWTREVFPSLVISPKWHSERRNVMKGDVVLIEDANALRGKWKMGVVSEALISADGKVRKAYVQYKNPNETVQRPVQKLIVIVPVDRADQ